ncbi:MAG: Asp-tRNA(Asn)/Glu-tRNA(Gln) amidotransferase subunit GatB [Solirubrobacteraceae bacterium]
MSEQLRTPPQPPAGGSLQDGPFEPVIGLEIHVQLATATKMFCGCELSFGEPPNTRTCPVCLGLPGSLPVVNARAVHFGLMIGLALGSELAPRSIFHRKNYFYPDLPKGYQISQHDEPLCRGGRLESVRIHRVHLEEDAAKLIHVGASGRIHGSDASIVDFNRGGTPLAEIVTEPDVRSPEQASEWLKLLRATLRQLGVSDVNMEEGSLRCDANISLRPVGSSELGVKTELKNMNSFRFLERGIRAEIARQHKILQGGGTVVQETLHFDPASGAITSLRSKEEAHDYRYFPEPDLVPVAIDEQMLADARAAMSELPAERAERLQRELELSAESAQLLAFRAELGDYFEAALAAHVEPAPPPQALANWVTGELVTRLGEHDADAGAGGGSSGDPSSSRVQPRALAALIGLVAAKRVSVGAARQVLDKLIAEGGDPAAIVEAEGLAALDGGDELAAVVAAALAANEDAAKRVREGNAKAIGPIVGHVMRETKGRADGTEVARLVHEQLGV